MITETYIDIPEQFTFTFVNKEGREIKVIAIGYLFMCYECQSQFQLAMDHTLKMLRITEHHSIECPYVQLA